jgi:PHD/YefM family antitoxin component YafN of YafNO toxin-antitoxin module
MIDLANIRSLSDFQRNTREHLKRLRKTGKAEVLTINGQAALVVQSAEAYQKLLNAVELAESVGVLHARLEAAERGEKGVPAGDVLADIRAKLGLTQRR